MPSGVNSKLCGQICPSNCRSARAFRVKLNTGYGSAPPAFERNLRKSENVTFRTIQSDPGRLDSSGFSCNKLVASKPCNKLYRVPEIVTRGRFPDGGESDSTWRTQEARHVGSDTIAPGF